MARTLATRTAVPKPRVDPVWSAIRPAPPPPPRPTRRGSAAPERRFHPDRRAVAQVQPRLSYRCRLGAAVTGFTPATAAVDDWGRHGPLAFDPRLAQAARAAHAWLAAVLGALAVVSAVGRWRPSRRLPFRRPTRTRCRRRAPGKGGLADPAPALPTSTLRLPDGRSASRGGLAPRGATNVAFSSGHRTRFAAPGKRVSRRRTMKGPSRPRVSP